MDFGSPERKTSQNVAFWHFVCSRELLHQVSGADLILYNCNLFWLNFPLERNHFHILQILSALWYFDFGWFALQKTTSIKLIYIDLNKYIFSIELSKNFNVSILFTIKNCHFWCVFFLKKSNRSVTQPPHSPKEKQNMRRKTLASWIFWVLNWRAYPLSTLVAADVNLPYSSMVPVVKKWGVDISNRIVFLPYLF